MRLEQLVVIAITAEFKVYCGSGIETISIPGKYKCGSIEFKVYCGSGIETIKVQKVESRKG